MEENLPFTFPKNIEAYIIGWERDLPSGKALAEKAQAQKGSVQCMGKKENQNDKRLKTQIHCPSAFKVKLNTYGI